MLNRKPFLILDFRFLICGSATPSNGGERWLSCENLQLVSTQFNSMECGGGDRATLHL
jgi:hypothetical protein